MPWSAIIGMQREEFEKLIVKDKLHEMLRCGNGKAPTHPWPFPLQRHCKQALFCFLQSCEAFSQMYDGDRLQPP